LTWVGRSLGQLGRDHGSVEAKGFNTAVIAEITGLSEAEIERLDIYG